MKIVIYADRVDPIEVAHHEPPHLDLYCLCLPSSLKSLNIKYDIVRMKHFLKFCRHLFVSCLFGFVKAKLIDFTTKN